MAMTEVDRVAQLVRGLFAAFLAGDRAALEEILSDDFTFNSPRDDHINKTEYFERCFPHGDEFRMHRIEQLCTLGNEAFVRYLAVTRDGTRFCNTEYIKTDGYQVKAVDVFFGGAPDA